MLILLFLLFIVLNVSSSSLSSLIVTYGKPLNYSSNFETYPTNFWDNCVRYCYLSTYCVVAHSPAAPINCQIFSANQVLVVQKLNSSDGQLVAFKIDSPSETCPVSQDYLLSYRYGSSSDSTRNYTHMININDAENVWKIDYQNITKCPSGWEMFQRTRGEWCIKTFGGPTQTFTQPQAEKRCALENATLTGLEAQEEKTFVTDSAMSLLGSNYPNFSAFWISGFRKPECAETGWEDISYCNDNIKQFTWSDNYLFRYSGIVWDQNTPDRNASGNWQNCVQIWIREVYQQQSWDFDTHPNGAADDALCDEAEFENYAMRGYACGKVSE